MASKNIVFIADIKIEGEGRYSPNRSFPYKFSIESWKRWCEKNGADLFVMSDLLLPNNEMGVCWQKCYLFDILKSNEIDYNQILMVDSDTIVHPNCPDFFSLTDNKLTVVPNEGSYDWVCRSIENYNSVFFNNKINLPFWEYFNSGFMIINSKHETLFSDVINFFINNKEKLIEVENSWHAGTVQTPLNFLIKLRNIPIKFLPYEYNMMDLNRKEVLRDDLPFTKFGWVYHFNCIPNNKDNIATYHWMEKTFNHLYGNNKI